MRTNSKLLPLIFCLILLSTISTAIAHLPETSSKALEANPVIPLVQQYKASGLSNSQIVSKLEEQGYGWNPETNAMWKGKISTGNAADLFMASRQQQTLDYYGHTSVIRTYGVNWAGIDTYMSTGDMAYGDTVYCYSTTQLVRSDVSDWTEVLVARYDSYYRWWCYDYSENQIIEVGIKETSTSYADKYTILSYEDTLTTFG
jgi:hypothetical protein